MDEAMSILRSKNNKAQDPDEAFCMTIGASLSIHFKYTKQRICESKYSRNHISSTIWKSYGSICTKSYDANTANHLSSWNSNSPQLTKKLV